MAYEQIRQKYLGNTPTQPTTTSGGSFSSIREKYLGNESGGAEYTSDINPISRLMSGDPAGQKKTSIYTPLDYLLNGPLYGYAGALESSFKKTKKLAAKKKAGGKVGLSELLDSYMLNPSNWGGAAENLKPENRKTITDVTNEQVPDKPALKALAFITDLSVPSIPISKVSKAVGLTKLGSVVRDSKAGQKVAKATAPLTNALKYRGGQPKEYVEQAEAALKASRQGMERAKEVGTLLSEGLTNAQQIRLGQIMKGGITTAKTEADLVRRATEARKIIDDLSTQVIGQAMKGGGKELTATGLAADLVNTLVKTFKKPDETLGVAGRGWRSPDELAQELLGVFAKHQPAHAQEMVDKTIKTADGGEKTVKAFQDIGAGTRGTVASVKGGQEIIKNMEVPKVGAPPVPEPYTEQPLAGFSQVSQGTAPVQGTMGVTKGVAEGLPQRAPARPNLPVETVVRDAPEGGLRINDRMIQTIESNMGRYLPRLYRKYEQNPEGLVKFLNTNKGKIVRDRLMRKEDIPDDVRTAMGEILQPAYPAAKAVAQMSDMVAKSKLFRWTADNFAQAENVTGDMVQLGDDAGFGVLAGKWLPKEIAGDISRMVIKSPEGTIEKIYKKVLGAWKTGKVLLNPAARARNQISNMVLMNVVGNMPSYEVMNPLRWKDAALDLKNQTGIYKILKNETDLLDSTFYGNEIAPFLDEFNLQTGNALQRWMKAGMSFAGDSYQAQEQLGKMVIAKYWIENDKTVAEAAKIAEDALFDYGKIPEAVRKIRDVPFGFPFLTFQYKAIPAVTKALVNKPGKIARLTRTGNAVESEAEQRFGAVDKTTALPDYMQGGQYLRLPIQENGEDLYLDLNYLLPWGGLAQMTGEPQNPAFTLPADLYRNKSSFTQKEIWKDTDSDAQKVQKAGDYIYKALMPSLAPAIPGITKGGYSFEKVVSALQQRPDYFGRVRGLPVVLSDVLFGIKATPINYEQTAAIKQGEKTAQIRDLQQQIRTINLDKRRFPDEKRKAIQDVQRRMEEIRSDK